MKTIAILTSNFPPTNIVGSFRPFRLVKHIVKFGWKALIFTQPPKLGEELDQDLLKELVGQYEIYYVRQLKTNRLTENFALAKPITTLERRAVGFCCDHLQDYIKPDLDIFYVPAFVHKFISIYRKEKIDIVLTTSPVHSIHLAGLLIKNFFNLPWIVDFRDPWDDFLKTGIANINNSFEKFLENKVITKSDIVVSTTKTYTDILKSRHFNINQHKFKTITNSFDREKTFRDINKNKDKDSKKFVICYTGIFYPLKDPYDFFRELRLWFDNMDLESKNLYQNRLEVHLIGSGDLITRQVIHELNLEANVIFFDRMSHVNAIQKTLQADMALISTGTGEKTRPGWLPSKLFEYLGCRIPILALIREGEMAEIIRKTNSGYVITSNEKAGIRSVIMQMIDRKFNLKKYDQSDDFLTFNNIDQYEERSVMNSFLSIINEASSLKG